MITREHLERFFNDDNVPFKTKGIDHDIVALNLLRNRIPYDKCKTIIQGADHDQVYLCDIEECLPYLNEEDLIVLADCNLFVDKDNDCLSMFV
jgi:glycosyltransferase involved in cell wall biosynthesis